MYGIKKNYTSPTAHNWTSDIETFKSMEDAVDVTRQYFSIYSSDKVKHYLDSIDIVDPESGERLFRFHFSDFGM